MCVFVLSYSFGSNFLRLHGLFPSRLLCPWKFPGKNTGAGCHCLLQGIFPTQEWNWHLLCLMHCKQITYLLSHGPGPRVGAIPLSQKETPHRHLLELFASGRLHPHLELSILLFSRNVTAEASSGFCFLRFSVCPFAPV